MNTAMTNNAKIARICQMDRCYACDARAVGAAERWANGSMEHVAACKRHADPTITKVVQICRYCGSPVRAGSLSVGDGMYAHHACHAEDERANRC